jgi:hypothetical protein
LRFCAAEQTKPLWVKPYPLISSVTSLVFNRINNFQEILADVGLGFERVENLAMNRFLKTLTGLFLLALASCLARGQTVIDLKTQTKSVDFTGAAYTKPFKSGSALPATCGTGEAFLNTGAPAGKNFYTCTSPNTWTIQSGSSVPSPAGNANAVLSNDGTNLNWQTIGGDVSGPIQAMRVNALQGLAIAPTTPADGQVLSWDNSNQVWAPATVSGSSGPGGSAIGKSNYSQTFFNATTVTILGTSHNLVTSNLIVACYDNTVTPLRRVEPDSVTLDPATYNVVVYFNQPQSGVCVVNGSGGGTPISLVGDVSGTTDTATVVALQGFAVSSTPPTDSEILTWSSVNQQWQPQAPGAGGVSGSSTLNAVSVTYQSGVSLVIGSTCTVALPCNVRFGSTVYSFTQNATVTVAGGSGSIYIYVASNGIITASSGGVSLTCTSGCATLTQDGFPTNTIPVAIWTANNGVLDQQGGHDERAFLSSKALGSGLGIVVLDSGTQSTVSVDAALIPTYLIGTANLSFPSIPNGSCSSELTIGLTGANSGDPVAPGWPPSMPQGVLGMMRVSSAGVVGVRICNFSGSAVTPQADNFQATVVRSLQ